MTTSETFEQAVKEAISTGDYLPAWKALVNTEFFVPVTVRKVDAETEGFNVYIQKNPQDGEPCVFVSEQEACLQEVPSSRTIKMFGGQLVGMLRPDVSIVALFSDGGFGVPLDVIAWLRSNIKPAG